MTRVLLVMLIVPLLKLKIPPPKPPGAELLLIMLSVTLTVPVLPLSMPPPVIAELLVSVLVMTLTVPVSLLRMPLPPPLFPFEMVNPETVTTPGLGTVTLKMRKLGVPPTVLR